jgi:hypothetical protein
VKRITLGHSALVLAFVGAAASLVFADYDRAESNMRTFYSQMAKANFQGPRHPTDARRCLRAVDLHRRLRVG